MLAIVLTAAIAFGATEPKAQQCKETTKAGAQCKVMTRDTTRICWIHQRSISAKAAKNK